MSVQRHVPAGLSLGKQLPCPSGDRLSGHQI